MNPGQSENLSLVLTFAYKIKVVQLFLRQFGFYEYFW